MSTPFDHEATIPEGEHPPLAGRYRVGGDWVDSRFAAAFPSTRSSFVAGVFDLG